MHQFRISVAVALGVALLPLAAFAQSTPVPAPVAPVSRTGPWSDASFVATNVPTTPPALIATASRSSLWFANLGAATMCWNDHGTAAVSGSGCAPGSWPIEAGSKLVIDEPALVTNGPISIVCVGATCPLTIWVKTP